MIIIRLSYSLLSTDFVDKKIRKNGGKKTKKWWIEMYVLRFPSVTTWMQSLLRVVIGHLHSAPERFVPGCKFWSNGAPTSSLLSSERERRKKKSKYIIQIWHEKWSAFDGGLVVVVYLCNKNNTTVEKGSLNHYSAPKDVIVNLCLLSGNAYYIYHPITECLRFCRCYRSTTTGKERY